MLVLTARDQVEDRVRGLTGGADDYLVKPFAFAELLAPPLAGAAHGGEAFAGFGLSTAALFVYGFLVGWLFAVIRNLFLR